MSEKITTFTDLIAWQKAHRLAVDVYNVFKSFPTYEQYGLANQMRRSVGSISANIAEGFSRSGKKEKLQFYSVAKGSLTEFQTQSLLSKDVGYIEVHVFDRIANQIVEIGKLITGLQKTVMERNR